MIGNSPGERWLWAVVLILASLLSVVAWLGYFRPELLRELADLRYC
ncbi:MAG: hypothetical protein AMXMBFR6_16370 [Betaproteobacteria bacterium]|jgi:hypothetical protein|nr:hypothetical protein [Rhodocyclaceae bacterium]MCG3186080.1 hypothetical protein [Rhodocyclaceae bacterium]